MTIKVDADDRAKTYYNTELFVEGNYSTNGTNDLTMQLNEYYYFRSDFQEGSLGKLLYQY